MKWHIVLIGVLVLGLIVGGVYMNRQGITIQDLFSTNILGILSAQEWMINTSTWDGNDSNFSVGAQDTNPFGIFFKSDGTKMYFLGDINDRVYSYSLSTAWMINTSVWDGNASNFSVAAQDASPRGLFFKSDGTKMYVNGINGDGVYSYSLSTPWQINTSVWDGSASNFSVLAQDTIVRSIFFNSSGTKMYLTGGTNNIVYSYTLSTPWMINTSVWDGNASNFSVGAQDTKLFGIFFKEDGTKMYVNGATGDRVYSYTLSTPWQINTSVWDGSASNLSVGAQDNELQGIFLNSSGTKMYLTGGANDIVYSYTMTLSADTTSPQWSSNSTNSTLAGTLINHTVVWTDNIALSNFTFSFDNGTGTFVNDSSVSMTGTSNQSSAIKFVNQTVGSTIRWIVYAWDATGNTNITSTFTYTTTSASSCTYSSGDWNINLADNCVITTVVNVYPNRVVITGTGSLTIDGGEIITKEWHFRPTSLTGGNTFRRINGGDLTIKP